LEFFGRDFLIFESIVVWIYWPWFLRGLRFFSRIFEKSKFYWNYYPRENWSCVYFFD